MEAIRLPSGASLEITLIPYEDAWAVTQMVSDELKGIDFDVNSIDWAEPVKTDAFKLKGPILSILANKKIIEAFKLCRDRCLYNGQKIDNFTFEKKETRQDFIPVVFYVIKENIAPFFGGLISFFQKS
jgi:hypothetical protein